MLQFSPTANVSPSHPEASHSQEALLPSSRPVPRDLLHGLGKQPPLQSLPTDFCCLLYPGISYRDDIPSYKKQKLKMA